MICNVYVRRTGDTGTTRARHLYTEVTIPDGPRKWAEERASDLGEGTFVFVSVKDHSVYVLHIARIQQPTHRVVD